MKRPAAVPTTCAAESTMRMTMTVASPFALTPLLAHWLLATGVLFAPTLALAQPANLPIGGFEFAGEIPPGPDETSGVLATFMRAPASAQTLQKASAALEAVLQPKGYTLRRASLQAPEVGNQGRYSVVRLEVAKSGAPNAVASQTVPEASGATTTFPIRGYELGGDMPLSADETSRILAPFIRQEGNLATLQQAGAALEAALREKGFALHRVTLPPQEVGNKVNFEVVKFAIGKITVQGSGPVSEDNVRASLPELREGEAPNFRTLAVQTAMANENPA